MGGLPAFWWLPEGGYLSIVDVLVRYWRGRRLAFGCYGTQYVYHTVVYILPFCIHFLHHSALGYTLWLTELPFYLSLVPYALLKGHF